MGVHCTHRVLCYLSAFGLPELDLLKSSGQSLSQKRFGFQSTQISYKLFFNLDLVSRISEFRRVLLWSGLLLKGKLPVQSLVPTLSLKNLIPFTIIFSSVYLSLKKSTLPDCKKQRPSWIGNYSTPPNWQKQDASVLAKTGQLRIDKIGTPTDWQQQDPSGLAKAGPLRIGKIGTLPDWENWDPFGLAKLGSYPIGKIGTLPDWQNWDPSGLGPLRICKIGTLPDWQNWDPSGLGPRICKNSFSETSKIFTRYPSGCVLRCYSN